jgi:glycosyltransferase involved in cell wall biosynthesis
MLIVYDHDDDSTLPTLKQLAAEVPTIRPVKNYLGAGPATAIRTGFANSDAPVVVVTMADGCDDPEQIDQLTKLVERGVVVACASRYVRGGQQVGGGLIKRSLSKFAGLSLHYLARVGTRDATNSFKAYSRNFVESVGIESDQGFEIGIELVAKAKRARLPVAEIPTIWLDRSFGESKFKLSKWAPYYLKWYFHALGR